MWRTAALRGPPTRLPHPVGDLVPGHPQGAGPPGHHRTRQRPDDTPPRTHPLRPTSPRRPDARSRPADARCLPAHAGCLSRVPRRVARTVLRGPRRSNALGLPDQRHCWPGGHSTWIHCRSVRRSVRTIAPRIRVSRRRGGGARRGMMVLPAYVAHPILGYPWSASRRLPALPSMTAVQLRDEGPGALGSHQRFALGQQADLLRAKDRDVIPRRGPPRATPSRVVAGSGNPGGRPDQVGDLAIEARATKCLPERVASPTCMTNTESS